MNLNDNSSEESSDDEDIIRDFEKEAEIVIHTKLLPCKSANRYNLVYDTFVKWKEENKADSFNESVFICYFNDLQKKVNPSTLWSVWSMLKKMMNLKHSIDINKYMNLKAVLKNNSKNHKPKKSFAFTWDQIMAFMKTADDYVYLGTKVLLVIGICGALRYIELTNLKYSNVEDSGEKFIVSVEDTKTYLDRSFIVGPLFNKVIKKYISLRSKEEFTDRFFVNYVNGKCTKQVIGKNKIGTTPMQIANFLRLENASRYTRHCCRRTSATSLSNSGANMMMLKQLGGWKSDTVAAGYVANSLRSKDLIFQGITHENQNVPASSTNDTMFVTPSTNGHVLATPSTSSTKKIDHSSKVSNNPSSGTVCTNEKIDSSKNQEIINAATLGLSYEDFCDSINQLNSEKNQSKNLVEFISGNGKKLPPPSKDLENQPPKHFFYKVTCQTDIQTIKSKENED